VNFFFNFQNPGVKSEKTDFLDNKIKNPFFMKSASLRTQLLLRESSVQNSKVIGASSLEIFPPED